MTKSLILDAMETLAFEIEESSNWFSSARVQWYPDLERADLRSGGPVAIVLPPTATADPGTRGKLGGRALLDLHVAIIAPIEAGTMEEGDEVIQRAESLAVSLANTQRELLDGPGVLAIVDVTIEPVMVADYAKQFNLWVSYLKLECRIGSA